MKKFKKIWVRDQYKQEKAEERLVRSSSVETIFIRVRYQMIASFSLKKQDALKREENLREAKSIVIQKDPSLPEAKKVSCRHCS